MRAARDAASAPPNDTLSRDGVGSTSGGGDAAGRARTSAARHAHAAASGAPSQIIRVTAIIDADRARHRRPPPVPLPDPHHPAVGAHRRHPGDRAAARRRVAGAPPLEPRPRRRCWSRSATIAVLLAVIVAVAYPVVFQADDFIRALPKILDGLFGQRRTAALPRDALPRPRARSRRVTPEQVTQRASLGNQDTIVDVP